MNTGRRRLALVGIALVVAFAMLPLAGLGDYWIYILTIGFYYAALASSWSFLVGYVGRISFAHAAMAGLGAYTSAMLGSRLGWPAIVTIPLAVVTAGAIGLFLGRICLKLHGAYLGLTTIAFSEIFRIAVTAEHEFTRGTLGLQTPPLFEGAERVHFYYVFLALVFAVLGLMWGVLRSRIGLYFAAIREDEDAAASLGVKVVRWKVFAFTLSSMVAGLGGAFYAHFVQLVSPSMMSLQEMGFVLSMAVIGGFQNIFYAAIGGVFLEVLLEALREIGGWRMTIFGVTVVLILRYAPNGLVGALASLIARRAR
ncbi:MAG: branched-chain amino acid ABC transporter permease [Rhodospirillales bacterium]|nr:branched-chain amino acid ABC transporter permease [Rhodospirillales bacterium]